MNYMLLINVFYRCMFLKCYLDFTCPPPKIYTEGAERQWEQERDKQSHSTNIDLEKSKNLSLSLNIFSLVMPNLFSCKPVV